MAEIVTLRARFGTTTLGVSDTAGGRSEHLPGSGPTRHVRRGLEPSHPEPRGESTGRDSGAENRSGPPPTPPAGTAQRGEDVEHRHPSYLVETEDIWGDGRHVAPPVIGEDPPEYHY
jgi:hypothetical protein